MAAPIHPLPTGEPLEAARRRARRIVALLRRRYPDPQLPLRHENALQLLVATILSAQCTDAMVNRVTPGLFARYRTAEEFARADPRELGTQIHSTGFFRQKAKAIIGTCRALVERFAGEVPATMEALLTLDGVGRKTANVILGGFYRIPGIVVDTHVRRLSQRLGLTGSDDPDRIEQDLMRLIPRREWSDFSLRLIFFGREICPARKPLCPTCPLHHLCPSARHGGTPPWMSRRSRRPTIPSPHAGG
jgi:endonuclease-3